MDFVEQFRCFVEKENSPTVRDLLPHVDMKRMNLVNVEATRPSAVLNIQHLDTQQLVQIHPRPVIRQGGLREGCQEFWLVHLKGGEDKSFFHIP